MENLFDFLENQENKENETSKVEEAREYIRLNSYVGSRMNTDFRKRNKINNVIDEKVEDKKEEIKIEKILEENTNENLSPILNSRWFIAIIYKFLCNCKGLTFC